MMWCTGTNFLVLHVNDVSLLTRRGSRNDDLRCGELFPGRIAIQNHRGPRETRLLSDLDSVSQRRPVPSRTSLQLEYLRQIVSLFCLQPQGVNTSATCLVI
jgi:hypothetical protein